MCNAKNYWDNGIAGYLHQGQSTGLAIVKPGFDPMLYWLTVRVPHFNLS